MAELNGNRRVECGRPGTRATGVSFNLHDRPTEEKVGSGFVYFQGSCSFHKYEQIYLGQGALGGAVDRVCPGLDGRGAEALVDAVHDRCRPSEHRRASVGNGLASLVAEHLRTRRA